MGDGPHKERVSWRVWAACAFSITLIGGSYVFAKGLTDPRHAEASEEEKLLEAIASRDSDADGLADWAEALYGTDPRDRDTYDLGMTDGEAVSRGHIVPKALTDMPAAPGATGLAVNPDLPSAAAEGTLTASFAQSLFTRYLGALQTSGGTLSEGELTAISNDALEELAASVAPAAPFKTAREITVSGEGAAAMLAFAAAAETALESYATNATSSELEYLKAVLEKGDTAALGRISERAQLYRTGAVALAALPVPKELAATDLALINGLARLSAVTSDLALVEADPLAAMLALKQYPYVMADVVTAFGQIAQVYRAAGIMLPSGKAGSSFVNVVADMAAGQARTPEKP